MWPRQAPYEPTVHDLHNNGRLFPPNYLHQSWLDYLYWDAVLEPRRWQRLGRCHAWRLLMGTLAAHPAGHRRAVAAKPSAVRTRVQPCPFLEQRASSRGSGFAGSVASRLLVRRHDDEKRVQGQFATRMTAPMSQSQSPVCHHATSPSTKPMSASGACMAAPRL